MGNWRTVNMTGSVDSSDVDALYTRLSYSWDDDDKGWEHFTCLSFNLERPSICGINDWVSPTIDVCGNLAERDYSVEDIAATLRELVIIAPSLQLTMHCGDERESETCIATITVSDNGVTVGPPEVSTVTGVSEDTMRNRLLGYLER